MISAFILNYVIDSKKVPCSKAAVLNLSLAIYVFNIDKRNKEEVYGYFCRSYEGTR